ncbi:MAG: STAS domain-containing protein [Polyangiaceae bacterium]|nr:STAS domain-containing protein [Polyangiaceae bacterium]
MGETTESLDNISTILLALSDVAAGDYTKRLELALPETTPLGALCLGVNELVDSLGRAAHLATEAQRELEEKLRVVAAQREAIHQLSTPVIEIWHEVLCLPIVGLVDGARSTQMTESLLHAVVEKRARCVIVDITGIEIMDTHTVDLFMRMIGAVRLLGARCVMSGINPRVAETIVQMGLDLQGVETHHSLRSALRAWVKRAKRNRKKG